MKKKNIKEISSNTSSVSLEQKKNAGILNSVAKMVSRFENYYEDQCDFIL